MAAASFPTLDQMTGARAGGYLSDHHPTATSEAVDTFREAPAVYQFAPRQNPQGEVDLAQFHGSSLTWLDVIRAQDSTSTEHIEPGGALHEGYERAQGIPGVQLHFGTSEDTAGRHEHQQDFGVDASLGNDRQLELLTFPEGEVDAVTITSSDLEGLQPMGFLSNNTIDLYIKYLERRLSSEERRRFYFFNSFFFTKLLGNSSVFTDIDQREVNYDQVRKWTGEVNLFEKDYVFIPILRSSHWSLIVICHLSGLTSSHGETDVFHGLHSVHLFDAIVRSRGLFVRLIDVDVSLTDKRKGSPCVFHLDPVEGKHDSFEGQVRSYIIQTWMERSQYSHDRDRIILALACQMKYVRAKVPQQGNGHDCGLYLLHYVEVFIRESTSPDFSFGSSNGGPHFTSPHFAVEVSAKRMHIQSLILELSANPPERAARRIDIQPKPQSGASGAHGPNAQPKRLPTPPKEQNKTSKKWNEEETSVLLNRMVEGGRIRKGMEGATHWNLISEDIKTKLGTVRSEDECRRRYDTLLKAYKKIKKTGKPFCDITDAERVELNLATPLSEEWYKAVNTICLQRGSDNAKSRKRAKLHPSDDNGMLSSSPRNPELPPITSGISGCPEPRSLSRKLVVIPGFSDLDEDLRSTLVNLIQALSKECWSCKLEVVCQGLAIVQDRRPSEIRRFMFKLSELKLVSIVYPDVCDDKEAPYLKLSNLWVYKKFVEKVLRKNPDLDIYLQICDKYDSVTFPKAPLSLSLLRIRVLRLYECEGLEHADLSNFPELRSLDIELCSGLKGVTGWKVVKELGWLEIRRCPSYKDFPRVLCLPSLREICLGDCESSMSLQMIPVPDFSQCVRLRRLEILRNDSSALNNVDLSTLRSLEVLIFRCCRALTTIQGLSGLHSLTKLDLGRCGALRRVPELGCLKALTHLDVSRSGVEEIPGVQEMHLLTSLLLEGCRSLETLPWLGHLKALAHLDISGSRVEKIPGVEDLVSLETLRCGYSRLKWLPELHHLPRLQEVRVGGTPLSTTDPSSSYFTKGYLYFDFTKERMISFVDDISDISDTEHNYSDDDFD